MLLYKLNSSGDSYCVTGESDLTVEKIIIPDTYEGLPVTKVDALFSDFVNLKELVLGNNITETAYGTLNIPYLEKLYFGRSVEFIGGPFDMAEKLSDIYYSGTEDEWQNVVLGYEDESALIFHNAKKHFGILGKAGILSLGEEKIFPYTHWDCIKNKPESISAKKVSYDNTISGLEAETVKEALDELNAKHFDVTALESWTDLLHLVRSGRARDFINIGDQFVSVKDGAELVWDVIGIDADTPVNEENKHSLTLQLRDCYINMPYSVPEASYFSVVGLEAGQYYIKMNNYTSAPVYYSFTLSEKLPSGGLVRISENTVYLYSSRESSYYTSFAVDSYSENEDDMTGTALAQGNYHIHSEMGNVNYMKSDVRQWLNAEEKDWWTFNNDLSLAPVDYLSVPGFCSGMDEDFLNAVNPVKKRTILADGSEIQTEDRFFLLSAEEVYASEGIAYEYYKENSSYTEPGVLKDSSRIKTLDSNARHWWLRNAAPGDSGLMSVLTDGGVETFKFAKILGYGIAPACCIC